MTELAVDSFDPRDREAELKDLFSRNGKPAFAGIFDHVYRSRAEQGLRSWIGTIDGRVVMHISVTPMRFLGGGRTMQGGVLGDLMVDDEHRDFWGPTRLLRKMVSDLKRGGQTDFLITTTTADAEPLFKAGGFKPFGTMSRYFLPLSLPYLGLARLKSRSGLRAGEPRVVPRCDYETLASMSEGDYWRPEPVPTFYDSRIPRSESTDGTWIGVNGENGAGAGYALVSRDANAPQLVALVDAFWSDAGVQLSRVAHAAARWARAQRFRRLTLIAIEESHATQQLSRSGFVHRHALSSLLVNQLSRVSPPPVEQWFMTGFALSGW